MRFSQLCNTASCAVLSLLTVTSGVEQWGADVGRSCWLDSLESQLQQGRNLSLTASALASPLLPLPTLPSMWLGRLLCASE